MDHPRSLRSEVGRTNLACVFTSFNFKSFLCDPYYLCVPFLNFVYLITIGNQLTFHKSMSQHILRSNKIRPGS